MADQIPNNIEFEKVSIETARDVVICSFIAQKSLSYLDLSACEKSMPYKIFFTEEQCRKLMEPRRKILYRLNLDLPINLESSLRTGAHFADIQEDYERFHLGALDVSECVYTRNIAGSIIRPILSAENKTEKLRKYLKVIKLLKLNECLETSVFLFDSLILALYPFCPDSNLVVEYANTLSFHRWIYHTQKPVVIGYVLYHALRIRFNIWQSDEWMLDPINSCVLFRKPGNIGILLKYGTAFHYDPNIYLAVLKGRLVRRRMKRLLRKNIPIPKLYLFLQLFCYSLLNNQSWQGLLYIWRSIPNPYFTKSEIHSFFERVISMRQLNNMIEKYKRFVVEERSETLGPEPRSLQHLCRVAIRFLLTLNSELPIGIGNLDLPHLLRDYLNIDS